MREVEDLFSRIQEEALPGVWSRGVALARDRAVQLDQHSPEGFVLRVTGAGKSVSPKVSVWPLDDDVHCDCGDVADPCVHAVAAVVALKNGWITKAEPGAATQTVLIYRLMEKDGRLGFQRWLRRPSGEEIPLKTTLVSWVGGVSSGRISEAPVAATREDFRVDQVVSSLEAAGAMENELFSASAVIPLFQALREIPRIEFRGEEVTVDPAPQVPRWRVVDSGDRAVRLEAHLHVPAGERERFMNGAEREGTRFRPLHRLSDRLQDWVGRTFRASEFGRVVTEILPALEAEGFSVTLETDRLPRLQDVRPILFLELYRDGESLEVLPRLLYGSPPIAEVMDGELDALSPHEVPLRDLAEEGRLIRQLQSELHLRPRQRTRFRGTEAMDFLARSSAWPRTEGTQAAFEVRGTLEVQLQAQASGLHAAFRLGAGSGSREAPAGAADPGRVLAAWRAGESLVPLIDGGWARLPEDWLSRHGELLERFLSQRAPSGVLEKMELAEFAQEHRGQVAPELEALRARFEKYQGLPPQPLPSDLRADLRAYQRLGVDWLGFLRDSGLGAILADDMGLGKTLQALCAIRGRTLVVAPTSVLPSWESQIRSFRPGLRLNLYHGSARRLVPGADLVLTSYGTLRQDRALLTAEAWETVVLDEAQQIRNPESQVTRVVHSLQARFRLALTGTPIENRLDDLWSQVQFVQPGLLGTREEFQQAQIPQLRKKVRPLFLRRLKREVAPELPPKTEVTLYSTLNEREKSAYQTVLAATRTKVIQDLESGGSVIGALEALLRLRQICADPGLVPGFESVSEGFSSKLELLRETVEESLGLGHAILIFSQWTSFLDRVEVVLKELGVEFLRLDGSTADRSAVIDRFQNSEVPRVLLLSLKAGGVGLTLTRADHVILLDPWWNPAVEDQAADRAHRIGQTQPVLVQRLVARDTIEDRMQELQSKKREIASQILGNGGEGGRLELTREDLLELLR